MRLCFFLLAVIAIVVAIWIEEGGIPIQDLLPEASTPTASPTPMPVNGEVLNCMLDTRCSGLFPDGKAYKSAVADSRRYWIDPAMDQSVQRVIREGVMPTIEEWTHGAWVEVADYTGEKALRWEQEGFFVEHGCGGFDAWAGCSRRVGSSSAQVAIRKHHRQGYVRPIEDMRETGLHEVLHVLWDAEHANGGVMCLAGGGTDCEAGEVRVGNLRWPLKERRPLDMQVYTLYGHPAIRHGMTVDEVRALFVERP